MGGQRNISSLRENLDAPRTKAAAKANVCHREEKDSSVAAAGGAGATDLCADVVVVGGGGPLRLHTQTLNYMLALECVGGARTGRGANPH